MFVHEFDPRKWWGMAGWGFLGWILVVLAVVALVRLADLGPAGMQARWLASDLARWARERRMLLAARRELKRLKARTPAWHGRILD